MYKITLLMILLMHFIAASAQTNPYDQAMAAYQQKDYSKASTIFAPYYQERGEALSSSQLYDGACILALGGKSEQALSALRILIVKRFYNNYDHISTDSDLTNLHGLSEWKELLATVVENKRTELARTIKKVKATFNRVHTILQKDNGKFWGAPIWNDSLLALDPQRRLYSLLPLKDGTVTDSLWLVNTGERELNQSNAPQDYKGRKYAVILTSYLSDSCATVIHELFHLLQQKHIELNGNPIKYLDEYQARQYLRLEYQALADGLQLAQHNAPKTKVTEALNDAIMFRKLRQRLHPEFTQNELEIESCEGLANYTGFKFSDYSDKYQLAIREIRGREQAPTYTRTFPYATGPAYGLLFDFLSMNWRNGLNKVYNFADIFEHHYLNTDILIDSVTFSIASTRRNYATIHEQELVRKTTFDHKIAWFKKIFSDKQVLTVKLAEDIYNRSFDMNGTLVLEGKGMIYTTITGTDITGKNFGSFKTTTIGTDEQPAGILASFDSRLFTFPLPIKIEGNKIVGPNYEIVLNPEWTIKQTDSIGNMEIVKK
ncbi:MULTISPECIES: hypothetical protein [unclassified Arcicella]|uniref:hypothetical protein n=1 Tax=unclassified Arcicella TaxID=2644986 RepID=UPI0028670F59|nr:MULTISPECIES: hypothetical protein [unclassified Arcicella]MDR6564104.1 hypothetical protein [Arcicella sp. BE51]MDR6813857.1 hypothetical protein [Arcicella sp. BE140]MDR6825169.1 hypothetical protein [Arcicella sp. BE139]